jgi:hypothetical protein
MDKIVVEHLKAAEGDTTSIPVDSTADVFTKSKRIDYSSGMCLMYKATVAAGTPDVDLYLQQGPGLPVGAVGGGEGEAGNATDGWHTVGSKIADITDELWHSVTLSPLVLPFLRILADGQGANPATCVLTLKLGSIEELN